MPGLQLLAIRRSSNLVGEVSGNGWNLVSRAESTAAAWASDCAFGPYLHPGSRDRIMLHSFRPFAIRANPIDRRANVRAKQPELAHTSRVRVGGRQPLSTFE